MIQISYKFYVHNLKPLPPPDIHQILTMMLRTGQYMLSQEWVSKSVDLKGLNDLWKIACNPTDPVVTNPGTVAAAICHPRGLELSARNGGPSPGGGVWLYQNHTLDECRELAEMKRYELKEAESGGDAAESEELAAPEKRPAIQWYEDPMPSKPHERDPLSDGVKKVLALRDGSLPRYFAYRTTPNPEIDPNFPAELRHSHMEQPCFVNSDGIGVNDDLTQGEEGDKSAVPGEAGGGTGRDGEEPLRREVTLEDGY